MPSWSSGPARAPDPHPLGACSAVSLEPPVDWRTLASLWLTGFGVGCTQKAFTNSEPMQQGGFVQLPQHQPWLRKGECDATSEPCCASGSRRKKSASAALHGDCTAALLGESDWGNKSRFFFVAQTHMCLVSARSDGPDQADSQSTTYLDRVSHSSHAACGSGTYIWTLVSCHLCLQQNVAATPPGVFHKKKVQKGNYSILTLILSLQCPG